jgi:hypothetical protein
MTWLDTTAQVLEHLHQLPARDKRYEYGELRLKRMNILMSIPFFQEGFSPLRGYYFPFTEYSQRFEHNLRFMLAIFVYCSIVLSALQVGLGTDNLREWKPFITFAEWSIYLTLGFILFAFARIAILFLLYALSNLWSTLSWTRSSDRAQALSKRIV